MSHNRSVVVSPRLVWSALAGAAVVLVVTSVSLVAAKHWLWRGDPYGVVELFRLNAESNVPSFFSGLLFVLNSALLAAVCWARRQDGWRSCVWMFLAVLFLFLSFDEMFEVHERLIKPLRHMWHLSGLLYCSWVVVYVPALLLVGVVFFPVWLKLKPVHQVRLAVSAVIYVSGAVGFEMLGGAWYQAEGGAAGDLGYALMYTAEESLEMAGLIVFAASLLYMLADDVPELNVSFRSAFRSQESRTRWAIAAHPDREMRIRIDVDPGTSNRQDHRVSG